MHLSGFEHCWQYIESLVLFPHFKTEMLHIIPLRDLLEVKWSGRQQRWRPCQRRYCEVLILQATNACVCWKSCGRQHRRIYQPPLRRPLPLLWHTQAHTTSPFLLLEWKEVRVERRRTVKASCPERARAHTLILQVHTHTILMHARPPSINKLHQMLSANSPCKRERALHHGSAVSSRRDDSCIKRHETTCQAFLFSSGILTKQIKTGTLEVGKKGIKKNIKT